VVFVRAHFVREDAVSFEEVFFRADLASGGWDAPRRSAWRDDTVVAEQVEGDRTASLTDSVRESAGRTVTAMV
jgi:hypothetical protein